MAELDTQLPISRERYYADVAVLLGVASALTGVHLFLPASVVSHFVFTYGEPSLLTAWTAAGIHDSAAHLSSNLVWYMLVVGVTYTLYLQWGRRRLFWLLYGSLLVVAPICTVAVDYWLLYQRWGLVGPESIAYGFSGVVSSFGGLLVASLFRVLTDWYTRPLSIVATVAFLLSGLVGAGIKSQVLLSLSVEASVAAVLGTAVIMFVLWWNLDRLQLRRWLANHQDTALLIGTCGLVVVALVASMFTIESASDGRFPNVVAHGTGLITGLCVAGAGLLN